MLKSDDPKIIAKEIKGKTIEGVVIAVHSVVIKLTDGTFVDIELHENEKEIRTTMNMY